MQQRRHAKQQFITRVELMFFTQALKQDSAKFCYLSCVQFVKFEFTSQVEGRSDDLVAEVFVPASSRRHFVQ